MKSLAGIPTHSELRLESIARGMTVTAVIAAGWLFGSAEGWVYLFIALWLCVAGMLWLVSRLMASTCTLRARGLMFVAVLWVAYGALQTVGFGPGVVGVLNPSVNRIQTEAQATLASVNLSDEDHAVRRTAGTLSVSPAATRRAVALGFIYLLAFLLILNTHREWEQVKLTALVIVMSSSIMAIVAIVHAAMNTDRLLWVHAPRYGGRLFGPFSNRNHAAAYLNMASGLALGLLLSAGRNVLRSKPGSRRDAFSRMLHTYRTDYLVFLVFSFVVLAGSVCATLSRGGMLSLFVGLVAAMLIARLTGVLKLDWRVLMAGVVCLLVVALAAVGWEPIVDRMLTLTTISDQHSGESRLTVNADSVRMWLDAPLFGSGFGTFQHQFSQYSHRPLEERYLHAHNDWLQLLCEGGVVGAFLAALCLLIGGRHVWHALRDSRSRVRFLLVGLSVGVVTIGMHSFFDYAMHRSGVVLLLVAILGLMVAAPYAGGASRKQPPPENDTPRRCPRAMILVFVVCLVFLFTSIVREWSGELAFIRLKYMDRWIEGAPLSEDTHDLILQGMGEAEGLTTILKQNPESARDAGSMLLRWYQYAHLDDSLRLQLIRSAHACIEQAAVQAPGNYLGWLWLARIRAIEGSWDAAEKLLDRARDLVEYEDRIRLFEPPSEDVPIRNEWF